MHAKSLAAKQSVASPELLSDEVRVEQTMSIGDEGGMTIKDVLPDSDIIVCMAGKLVNEIRSSSVAFSGLGLMVLDECHHTRKIVPDAKMKEKYLNLSSRYEPLKLFCLPTYKWSFGDNENDFLF